MIVFNAPFPENCLNCPIHETIGCELSARNPNPMMIPVDCPFEEAEPVFPGAENSGVFSAPSNSYTVAECVCLMCLKRFIDVRPEGLLLKDMECPGCHNSGYVIETGEYMIGDEG